MKKCTSCKQEKNFIEFNKNASIKDGYQTQCKECHRVSAKRSRLAHPQTQKENLKRYRTKLRNWIREQKAKPCADCGIQYPYYVMQFDHVRGEKLFQLGNAYGQQSLGAIRAEVAKCEVVCANCHFERTHSRAFGDDA